MKKELTTYNSIIFDCDGVILDSNRIKTDSFYETVLEYGEEKAALLKEYHTIHGGISRFHKFEYFFSHLVRTENSQEKIEKSLITFASLIKDKLLSCPVCEGFNKFVNRIQRQNPMVISGGLESELHDIFRERSLLAYFSKICGSPATKETIFKREIENKAIKFPALYIGDSKYDYLVANENNIDFIFMTQYSEFKNWEDFFADKPDVTIIKNFFDLL